MQYQHNGAEVRCKVCKSVFVGASIESVMDDLQFHMEESHGVPRGERRLTRGGVPPMMHELNCKLCTKSFMATKYDVAARDLDRHIEEDHPRVSGYEVDRIDWTQSDLRFLAGLRISPN